MLPQIHTHLEPQNAALFRNSIFANVMTDVEPYQVRGGRKFSDTAEHSETQRGRSRERQRVEGGVYVQGSQGLWATTRTLERARARGSWEPRGGSGLPTLGLLASSTPEDGAAVLHPAAVCVTAAPEN